MFIFEDFANGYGDGLGKGNINKVYSFDAFDTDKERLGAGFSLGYEKNGRYNSYGNRLFRVKAGIICFLSVILISVFFVVVAFFLLRGEGTGIEENLVNAPADVNSTDSLSALSDNPNVSIYRVSEKKMEVLPLEEIVVGVLAGEMPADFYDEALMAQAVAARTYILKRLPEPYGSGLAVHTDNASICDDFAHCQAYVDEEQRKKNWGDAFTEKEKKIRNAVKKTEGLVLTCNKEVISPTFCSTCGGKTEAAADYWQSEVPSLQAVNCYWDTSAPRYLSSVYYTKTEMATKLGITAAELQNLKIAETSDTGRVKLVTCGEHRWKGSAFRSALGLNSTDFQWLEDENGFLISVKGFGHGVGLCQHGANGMAEAGADFRQILKHYYTDIEIVPINKLQ